jgi:hypothetical protein
LISRHKQPNMKNYCKLFIIAILSLTLSGFFALSVKSEFTPVDGGGGGGSECSGWGGPCGSGEGIWCCDGQNLHCNFIAMNVGICVKPDNSISDGGNCQWSSECSGGTCINNVCVSSTGGGGDTGGDTGGGDAGGDTGGGSGEDGGVGTSGSGFDLLIPNPVSASGTNAIIQNVIDFLFTASLVIAPLMIVVAAFIFVTAAGDAAKVTLAKKVIFWTAVGFLIALMARGIFQAVTGLL